MAWRWSSVTVRAVPSTGSAATSLSLANTACGSSRCCRMRVSRAVNGPAIASGMPEQLIVTSDSLCVSGCCRSRRRSAAARSAPAPPETETASHAERNRKPLHGLHSPIREHARHPTRLSIKNPFRRCDWTETRDDDDPPGAAPPDCRQRLHDGAGRLRHADRAAGRAGRVRGGVPDRRRLFAGQRLSRSRTADPGRECPLYRADRRGGRHPGHRRRRYRLRQRDQRDPHGARIREERGRRRSTSRTRSARRNAAITKARR